MRENFGRPDSAIKPTLTLDSDSGPIGNIITVLSRTPSHSKTPEIRHMVQSIFDPSQRRDKAIQFFSEIYYQKFQQFSDTLTAAFPPNSPVSEAICAAKACSLTFESYGQLFDLDCTVSTLTQKNHLFQATWWHNKLFNPHLLPGTIILGFEPNWSRSSNAGASSPSSAVFFSSVVLDSFGVSMGRVPGCAYEDEQRIVVIEMVRIVVNMSSFLWIHAVCVFYLLRCAQRTLGHPSCVQEGVILQ